MGFWIKKLVSSLLQPLPFGLIWIGTGILMLLSHYSKKRATICIFIGFCTITLFSILPISTALLNTLQLQYPALTNPPRTVTKIVVLGGGVSGGKNLPPNLSLGGSSLSRLVEGARLFKIIQKTNPTVKLILSGGRVFQSPSVAGKMQNTATMLGIPAQNTVIEDGSRDTYEEAIYLHKTLGKKPFILVTSGFHMPRSMALFQNLGMHPIAAPTQFLGKNYNPGSWYIPRSRNLMNSDLSIHEYLGIVWANLLGYIKP